MNQTDVEEDGIAVEQLLAWGHFYQSKGQNEEAITNYEQAAGIADETDQYDIQAKAYQCLGNVYTGTSEYKKAIEYYQKAREISPDLEADKMEVIAYQWLGYKHLKDDQHQESIKYYSEAVKRALQLRCKTTEVNASIGIGSNFESSGDKRVEREAHIYTNLGHAYYKSGDFDAAIKSYLKAQEVSSDHSDRKQEVNVCLILASTFQQLKQYEKAIESYRKALDISKELKDINVQTSLGMCYAYLGRFEEGLTCFEKALEIIRDLPEKDLEGNINEWCGYCSSFIEGRYQEGITFYERAKEIAKQIEEKCQEYSSNQAIGNILGNTGNHAKKKEYYEEATDTALEHGDKHCEATSCLNLASACIKDCDYEVAKKWYEKVLNILGTQPNNHLLREKALTGLGIALFSLGDTKEAIESIQKAKTIAKEETERGIVIKHYYLRQEVM